MMDVREKLVELLREAHSKATDASAFEDATYAQQLEMEADHMIAHGVTVSEEALPAAEAATERSVAVHKIEDKCKPEDFMRNRKPTPNTNADRIRGMSDEELAIHLNKLTDSYPGVCRELPECHADLEADRDIPLERCERCWVNWLRQSAEVDADGT